MWYVLLHQELKEAAVQIISVNNSLCQALFTNTFLFIVNGIIKYIQLTEKEKRKKNKKNFKKF